MLTKTKAGTIRNQAYYISRLNKGGHDNIDII